MSEYNVTFNLGVERITDYTFSERSSYIGEAELAICTANTNVSLKYIKLENPVSVVETTVSAGEIDLSTIARLADGWNMEGIAIYDSEGVEVAVEDGELPVLTAGTYTVVYSAKAIMSNTKTYYKYAVYAVQITVE